METLPTVLIDIISDFQEFRDRIHLSSTNQYLSSVIRSKIKRLHWKGVSTLPSTFPCVEELILKKKWNTKRDVIYPTIKHLVINLTQIKVLRYVAPTDLTIHLGCGIKYDLTTADVLEPNISKLTLIFDRKILDEKLYVWLRKFRPKIIELVARRRCLSTDGVFHYVHHCRDFLQELHIDGCFHIANWELEVALPPVVKFKNGAEHIMYSLRSIE